MQFKVNVNMNDAHAPSGTFDPLPVGEYAVEVLTADVKSTSTQGRNMIVLQLKVLEPSEYYNRRIFDRRNIPLDSEGPESFVAQRLKELFDAFPGCYDFDTGSGDTDLMVGLQAMVRTRNENDNRPDHAGEVQTRVARIYQPQEAAAANTSAPAEAPAEAEAPAPKPTPVAKPASVAKPAAPKPTARPAPVAKPTAAAPAPVQRSPFRRPANIPTPQ